jgi:DHA1 family bicyclomycin/chloramphenicol resistance-like MFS transporter
MRTSPPFLSIAGIVLLLTVVSRLASSLYLPALPAMQESLQLSIDTINHTLTVFFACFALSTLVAGPITDTYGRRVVIQYGLVFFILGSLVAGLAHTTGTLLIGRALQAAGSAFIPVSGRTMIRDQYEDHEVVGVLGWVGTLGSLVPILAPILGGFIIEWADWRATFYILAILGGLTFWLTWHILPETMQNSLPLSRASIFTGYTQILGSKTFTLVVMPASLCFIIQGIYFATAPYIFVTVFELRPSIFGLATIPLVLSLLLGRSCATRNLQTHPAFSVYFFYSCFPLVGGTAMVVLEETGVIGPVSFLLAASVFTFGFGGLLPISMKSVLTAWRERGGMASALFGCCTIGAMSIGSAIAGIAGDNAHDKVMILAILMLVLGIFIAASAACTRDSLA